MTAFGFYFGRALVVVLGMMWVLSGAMKLVSPIEFMRAVHEWPIAVPPLGRLVVAVLPSVELTLGAWLLAGVGGETWRRGLLWISSGMLGMFVAMHALAMAAGWEVGCGCWGTGQQMVGWSALWRTAGLFGLSLFVMIFPAVMRRWCARLACQVGAT